MMKKTLLKKFLLVFCVTVLFPIVAPAQPSKKPALDSLLGGGAPPSFASDGPKWDFRTTTPWQSADIQIHQGDPTNSSVLVMSGATWPTHLEFMYVWNVPKEGFRIFCVLDLLGRGYQAPAVQKIIAVYDKDFQADVLQFSALKSWEEMAKYQSGQREKLQTILNEHWDGMGTDGKCPQLYSVAIVCRDRE